MKPLSFYTTILRGFARLRGDPRFRFRNLLRAARIAVDGEKPVRHRGRTVYTTFLPPAPSRAALQAIEATDDSSGFFEGFVTGRRRAPVSLYWAVTSRCGYRCEHCSAAGRATAEELTTEEALRVVRDLQDLGVSILGFTGGEPLLRPDLDDLLRAVDDRSATILFTSGHGLDEDRARRLAHAGLFAVGVSLDSDDSAAMDRRRGVPGAFDAACAAVRACRAAGLYTMTQTVACPGFLASARLERICELSRSLGAHEIRILENIPCGRLAAADSAMLLSPEERAALVDFQTRMNKRRRGIKVAVFNHIESDARFGCGAGSQHAYLDAAGNLYPCDFVPLSFGNVREKTLPDLWASLHGALGRPRCGCLAMELWRRKLLEGHTTLPVPPAESVAIAAALPQDGPLPGFYRTLRAE